MKKRDWQLIGISVLVACAITIPVNWCFDFPLWLCSLNGFFVGFICIFIIGDQP